MKERIPDYMNPNSNWVGFDFDRTLATYTKWGGPGVLGDPIDSMVQLLKETQKATNCRIFTARVWPIIHYDPHSLMTTWDTRNREMPEDERGERCNGAIDACRAILDWCDTHLGFRIPITNVKDIHCVRLYDDIAIQVIPNTGKLVHA